MRGGKAPTAFIICPSNPYLSIDPVLAVPGMRDWISAARAPVLGVSPIICGDALKGPAAKIMREIGKPASAETVARHYGRLLTDFVIDKRDEATIERSQLDPLSVHTADIVMNSRSDRVRLASECLDLLTRQLAA
jgi:LPPG:FO 2-phospho-L-lactate transferase